MGGEDADTDLGLTELLCIPAPRPAKQGRAHALARRWPERPPQPPGKGEEGART